MLLKKNVMSFVRCHFLRNLPPVFIILVENNSRILAIYFKQTENSMNSPSSTSSPTFKNLKSKHLHSPVELKEQLRKNYKDKVKNCRNMLINKFRGAVEETGLRDTLTEIYKNLFDLSDYTNNDEEQDLWEEIKKELVQDELQWWLQEYEKSNLENVDWSSMEKDDNVICPLCQKTNLTLKTDTLSCENCRAAVKTNKSLNDVKKSVLNSLERHGSSCNQEAQFTLVTELNEAHIYLICESCMEMHAIV